MPCSLFTLVREKMKVGGLTFLLNASLPVKTSSLNSLVRNRLNHQRTVAQLKKKYKSRYEYLNLYYNPYQYLYAMQNYEAVNVAEVIPKEFKIEERQINLGFLDHFMKNKGLTDL